VAEAEIKLPARAIFSSQGATLSALERGAGIHRAVSERSPLEFG
jgi:hypothetical protein